MTHVFDTEIAERVGVNAAIIYEAIRFWCLTNKANDNHFRDGKHWCYNSTKAWREIFPYFTDKQITYALNKLTSEGLIIKEHYGKSKMNYTCWYALTGEGSKDTQNVEKTDKNNIENPDSQTEKPKTAQNCQVELTKLSSRVDKIVKSIQLDIHTINDNNDYSKSKTRAREGNDQSDNETDNDTTLNNKKNTSVTDGLPPAPAAAYPPPAQPENTDLQRIDDETVHPILADIERNNPIWLENLQYKSKLSREEILSVVQGGIEYLAIRGITPCRQTVMRIVGANLNNLKKELVERNRIDAIKKRDFELRKTDFWNEIVEANNGIIDDNITAFYAFYGPNSSEDGLMKFERDTHWNTLTKLLSWKARQQQS